MNKHQRIEEIEQLVILTETLLDLLRNQEYESLDIGLTRMRAMFEKEVKRLND